MEKTMYSFHILIPRIAITYIPMMCLDLAKAYLAYQLLFSMVFMDVRNNIYNEL